MIDNELQLNTSTDVLKAKLLQSTDLKEIDQIIQLFNLDLKKKEVIRANTLSDLQDKVADQLGQRIDDHGDEIMTKDLLTCLTSIQNILNKPSPTDIQATTNNILIQQNNVDVNVSANKMQSLSKDSRDRIRSVIESVLKNNQSMSEDIISEQ